MPTSNLREKKTMETTLEDLASRTYEALNWAVTSVNTTEDPNPEYLAASRFLRTVHQFYKGKANIFALKETFVDYSKTARKEKLAQETSSQIIKEDGLFRELHTRLMVVLGAVSLEVGAAAYLSLADEAKAALLSAILSMPLFFYLWSGVDATSSRIRKSQQERREYRKRSLESIEQETRELNLYPEWMYHIVFTQKNESFKRFIPKMVLQE